MKDDLPYFSHDNDARNHAKMRALRARYGWTGYGQFWALNEMIAGTLKAKLDLSRKVVRSATACELGMTTEALDDFLLFLSDREECGLIHYENGIVTSDRTTEDYKKVVSSREQKSAAGKSSAEKRWGKITDVTKNITAVTENGNELLQNGVEKHNRAEQSRIEENRAGKQADISSRDTSEIPDIADASMPPAACPFITVQEIKSACSAAPFQIRLSARDLEDIATRLSDECLDARFVAYVVKRAQDPGVKSPGGFARSALLGGGSFALMPDEYRAEQAPTKSAEPLRDPPPERCDECKAEVRHSAFANDAFCSNPECGAFWTWDEAFGWLKSEERAVAFGTVGADWREKVEKIEKGA